MTMNAAQKRFTPSAAALSYGCIVGVPSPPLLSGEVRPSDGRMRRLLPELCFS